MKMLEKRFKFKKAISPIIASVLMIALVIGISGVVWVTITNLTKDTLSNTESCYKAFGQLTINKRYTCYDEIVNPKVLKIAVAQGGITLSAISITVGGSGGNLKTYIINQTSKYANMKNFGDTAYNTLLTLPGELSGKTYVLSYVPEGFTTGVDTIDIIPIVGNSKCDIADSLKKIPSCASLG